MSDITTSIKIEADASKAVSEMQRLQSATENLKKTGKEVVITPEVKAPTVSGGGPVKIDVDASSIKTSSAAAAAAVSDISTQYQQAAISAQNANVTASGVNANIASTATASAAAVDNLGDSFQAAAIRVQAASEAQNTYNTYIATGAKEEEAVAAAVNKYNEAIAKSVRIIGGGTTTTRDWTAEAKRAASSFNEATVAAEKHEKAVGGIRGGINTAAEAYKNFSSGAASGLDGLRSVSMNVMADFMLIKHTAETFFELGGRIYEFFNRSDNSLELTSRRTLEVEKAFQRAGIVAKTIPDVIDELNKKIEETQKKMLDVGAFSPYATTAEAIKYQTERTKDASDAFAKQKTALELLRKEFEEMKKAADRRAAERTGLNVLSDEMKIRKEAEYDIADLKDKVRLTENKDEKDNLQIQIDNRKKLMQKNLEDLAKSEKEKEDQKNKDKEAKDKEEADRHQKILDDSRQFQINSMEGINKIDQQYLFDLDKINRQLAEAKDDDERNALIAMGRARLSQQQKETADYWKDWNDKQKEAADKAKEKARDTAEYQKSLMEELVGYQKQLVASFSGLQQSVFPKEAMGYLRQIAGAANKFP